MMEFLFVIFALAIIMSLSVLVALLVVQLTSTVRSSDKQQTQIAPAPIDYGRVIFENIVIAAPSSNTPHTEIDEVIVSPYGIFCIEYKAHVGIIFGSKNKKLWTQCKYDGKYQRHNPLHQNYKHVKALENLLQGNLNAPIHSFVVYTNAKVNVDSADVFEGVAAMEQRIAQHVHQVYSLQEYEQITRMLAIASSGSDERLPLHIKEVDELLAAHAA